MIFATVLWLKIVTTKPLIDNDYVVYLHKDSNGSVRYVGSGRLVRAETTCAKSSRGLTYEYFVNTHGQLKSEIIKSGLTKKESLNLEIELYNKYVESGLLLNKYSPNNGTKSIPSELLNLLRYSEYSPTYLVWSKDHIRGKTKFYNGQIAGSVSSRGYSRLVYNAKIYYAHRLIFQLHNPSIEINDIVIDHIDMNTKNNAIENLRAVTQQINSGNRKLEKIGKITPPYICWHKQRNVLIAYVDFPKGTKDDSRKVRVMKCFSLNKYTSFEDCLQEAILFRDKIMSERYSQYSIPQNCD